MEFLQEQYRPVFFFKAPPFSTCYTFIHTIQKERKGEKTENFERKTNQTAIKDMSGIL